MGNMRAIIGGSGVYSLAHDFEVESRLEPDTPYGLVSAEIEVGKWQNQRMAFLPRHGRQHAVPPHKISYRANIWALQQLGVSEIIAINAVGGIGDDYPPRTIAIPDQLIDYTSGREHSFFDGDNQGLEHIDFTWPYSLRLRQKIISAASRHNIDVVDGGTYGCTNGPRLETAAEVRKLAADGCNIVGMTGMPEAALAREAGLAYAAIALVVNWCAGLSSVDVSMDEIKLILDEEVSRVRRLILATLDNDG